MTHLAIALSLHTLAAVVWVGGMVFAYWILRPAAEPLAIGERQGLWLNVFSRFFPVVWIAIAVLLLSGYHLLFAAYGGFANAGVHIHIMHALGWVMFAIFGHIFFAGWKRFRRARQARDLTAAGRALGQIRRFIAINVILGVVVVLVASGGRYLA